MQLHLSPVLQELAALDAHLLVISFAPLPRLERYTRYLRDTLIPLGYRERGLSLPPDRDALFARTRFASDPALAVYHAYGLGRNSIVRVYGPRIVWQYLLWGLRGRRIRLGSDDTLQRGGNFVVGRDGRLTLAHTGRDQADRPPIVAILDALRRGGEAPPSTLTSQPDT